MINKIVKPLFKITKGKKDKITIRVIRNERRTIATGPLDINSTKKKSEEFGFILGR